MKALIDLKKEILSNKLNNLYVFAGEENYIRRIYYNKIGELYGHIKHLENVNILFSELEKRALFAVKTVYIVYNDMDFLKQKEKTYQRLIKLTKSNIVILVYDEIPDKGVFREALEDYITIFNKVTDDIALKYVRKESNNKISDIMANKIVFNCSNSYNNIVEEINKYQWFQKNKEPDKNDDLLDALTYAYLFYDRRIPPTPKEFANAFIQRNDFSLNAYYDIIEGQNILAYLPELYNTALIALYIKLYGKWDGGTNAYNAGEYWGRIKEVRDFYMPYTKEDLLDILYMVNKLDIDVRSGAMKAEHAWNYLLGVIL